MYDIVMQKKASLERCILQIRDYYSRPSGTPFIQDHFKQDAIAINMQRACELTIDMANMAVRRFRLGLPASTRDSFILLEKGGLLAPDLGEKLRKMVGFRNILVHDYHELDVELMEKLILENHIMDLLEFASVILSLFNPDNS